MVELDGSPIELLAFRRNYNSACSLSNGRSIDRRARRGNKGGADNRAADSRGKSKHILQIAPATDTHRGRIIRSMLAEKMARAPCGLTLHGDRAGDRCGYLEEICRDATEVGTGIDDVQLKSQQWNNAVRNGLARRVQRVEYCAVNLGWARRGDNENTFGAWEVSNAFWKY